MGEWTKLSVQNSLKVSCLFRDPSTLHLASAYMSDNLLHELDHFQPSRLRSQLFGLPVPFEDASAARTSCVSPLVRPLLSGTPEPRSHMRNPDSAKLSSPEQPSPKVGNGAERKRMKELHRHPRRNLLHWETPQTLFHVDRGE